MDFKSVQKISGSTYEVKLPIKSQFGAEFRRFSIVLGAGKPIPSYEEFILIVQDLHRLNDDQKCSTHVTYVASDGDTLPISNNENLRKALETRGKVLRLIVQHKGETLEEQFGYGFSERLTPWGFVPTPGIFISRLLPNGLAASTNLLNVNDEIIEVNGIETYDTEW
ncbi:PB1 domain protein [Ancylostoma duodenale]|uniref:PB1 domain protein n=1 Tax=Ancylostoma duodenale TaxID=51022 RepID=A0A0C2GI94_9BILA|nr:PB1 domain protein [Ancylostoma duodenale]